MKDVSEKQKWSLDSYRRWAENCLLDFRSRNEMRAQYTVNWGEDVATVFRHRGTDAVIKYDWTVRCGERVRLDVRDELVPDLPPDSNPMIVERGEYEYHATIEDDGEIIRVAGPDHGKYPPVSADYAESMVNSGAFDRHWFHHVDEYYPFQDASADLRFIDPSSSPNVEEFCCSMLGWWYNHRHRL